MILTGIMNNSDENLLNKIVSLMQTDNSVDAPQDSIKWAKSLFLTRSVAPKKSLVQKVLAVLQMDISKTNPAFGERSAAASKSRQMLFDAGDTTIDLRISETENAFTLRGQLLGDDFQNISITLNEFESKTNELGEFLFTSVQNGIYNLTIEVADTEIVIENLEIN